MDVTGFGDALRRRWRVVALLGLVGVAVAVLVSAQLDKRYRSTTRMLVAGSGAQAGLLARIATTETVLGAAERSADGGSGAAVAARHPSVRASVSAGQNPFLTVSVTADTPAAARALAAAYPLVLPGAAARLTGSPAAGVTLTVVEPAGLPRRPVSPRPLADILAGLAVGALAGVPAVAVLERLGRARDPRRLPAVAGRVLGTVPREYDDERLVVASRPASARAGAYRHLAAALDDAAGRPRSVVVTSTGRGEGRSSTVANLALSLARGGRRVVVVDADLRHPGVAALFNVPAEAGLADLLAGRMTLDDALVPVPGEQVTVLPGGPAVGEPREMLSSAVMGETLRSLSRRFDVVLVDAAPALAGTDVLVLSALSDGLVVVTRPRPRVGDAALRRTLAAVDRGPARLLGVLVNAVEPASVPGAAGEDTTGAGASVVVFSPTPWPHPELLERPSPTWAAPRSGSRRTGRRTAGAEGNGGPAAGPRLLDDDEDGLIRELLAGS